MDRRSRAKHRPRQEPIEVLEDLLRCRPRGLVGITLGGSEHEFPPARFEQLYATAREHGLRLSVHAGEALGPQSVWDALRILGAERIGHGIRSIEDPELVAHLAEQGVPLEVCPTSNIRTGVCRDYPDHPLPSLLKAGVPVTLNTDDPTFFRTTLVDECLHARDMGISEADIIAISANGFSARVHAGKIENGSSSDQFDRLPRSSAATSSRPTSAPS